MRPVHPTWTIGGLLLVAGTLGAQDRPLHGLEEPNRIDRRVDAAIDVPRQNPGDAVAPGNAAAQRSSPPESKSWRYRWHNGQWWYWLPSNRWVVWSGSDWTPHEANAYSRQNTPMYRSYYGGGGYSRGGYNYYPGTSNEFGRRDVRGRDIEGGGDQGIGGPLGSRQEMGNIRARGSVNSSQSAVAGARANLGTFGTAGGQIGGSGAAAIQAPGGVGPGGAVSLSPTTRPPRTLQPGGTPPSAGESAFGPRGTGALPPATGLQTRGPAGGGAGAGGVGDAGAGGGGP